jgi:hypothetical protein
MGGRRFWLVLGLVLAAGATAAVLLTDDPRYLRVALLAMCWAFVVAAFLAGDRRADQVAAAAREAELRHAYDLELEREVAARHQYEAELEGRLRREAQDAVRAELVQVRVQLASLTEIRGELAGLGQLRTELAGLGELRADLGRMRTELTEQLSGELLVERMVMRAQSVRGQGPADGRTIEAPSWDVDRWQETRVVPAEPEPARDGVSSYDDLLFGPSRDQPAEPSYEPPSYEPPSYEPPAAEPVESPGHARLEQILAESGVDLPRIGRPRRRHGRD